MRRSGLRQLLIGTAGLLLIAAQLGCAARRPPVPLVGPSAEVTEIQQTGCDEFARGEVKRLGESVPLALVKGTVIGFALDVSTVGATLHPHVGADDRTVPSFLVERSSQQGPNDPARGFLGSSVVGGPQLARDAARTNDDVYAQAIQTCLAPSRLARQLGATNVHVATSLERLATGYAFQHDYARAEPLQRQALAIWETILNPNDPRVATALEDYATVLRQLHREAEARPFLARAAALRAQVGLRLPDPPAVTRAASHPRCDSSVTAVLFVLCRGARPE
jgi:Tetratricopeptide repeat